MSELHAAVRDHGRRQVEIKSRYPLSSSNTSRYVLDAWLYSPVSLGMNGGDYSETEFFGDTTCLTRFAAPHMALSQLISPDCTLSPLARIRGELSSAAMPGDIKTKRIIYEMRSLANIYKTETEALGHILADAVRNGRGALVKDTIKQNLELIRNLLGAWRELYGLMLTPSVRPLLREAYAWTDEFISLTTEAVLFELHRRVESDEEAQSLGELIAKIVRGELEHRRMMGYHTISPESNAKETEERIYREGALKKWAQSALYLSLEESGSERRMSHLMGATAAAAAMSFAVITTIAVERILPGRSMPWALAVVVAYIFKDRIKESLRDVLARTLPGILTDRRSRLVDPASGRRLGETRSRVRFITPREVPPEVRKLRDAGAGSTRRLRAAENLLHFRRVAVIHNRRLREDHERLGPLSDIVRLNLAYLLRNMDDPKKSIPTFAFGEPREISGRRVYHVNLILRLSPKGRKNEHLVRYRLVLSRSGLTRLELVED